MLLLDIGLKDIGDHVADSVIDENDREKKKLRHKILCFVGMKLHSLPDIFEKVKPQNKVHYYMTRARVVQVLKAKSLYGSIVVEDIRLDEEYE